MEEYKNVVDVEYQEVGDEIYLTAPQMAQRINDSDIRVRHWADVFGNLIGIEKVNGRKRYKESDVEKFLFIKDLLDNKNFKHDQAKIYIAKHGFKYAEFDSGLVDPKDPLGFQALAAALSVEVKSQLNSFAEELITSLKNELNESLLKQHELNLELKAEIESAVDELVSEKLDTKLNEFKSHIDSQEQEARERDIKLLETLKTSLESHKRDLEIQQNNSNVEVKPKQNFLSRIFKR